MGTDEIKMTDKDVSTKDILNDNSFLENNISKILLRVGKQIHVDSTGQENVPRQIKSLMTAIILRLRRYVLDSLSQAAPGVPIIVCRLLYSILRY